MSLFPRQQEHACRPSPTPARRRTTPRRAAIVLGVAVIALLGGCYKATFIRDPNVVASGPQHEEWTDFFIFGLVGNQEFDVHRFCGNDDVAMVRTGGNAGTTIISILTIGIYTPRKVYVMCASGAKAPGVAYEIDTDWRGAPRRLLRHAGSRVQEAPLVAIGEGQWSARLVEGDVR